VSNDEEHTTTNFTIWPGALKAAGYATAAIGKWDNGMVVLNSTATFRGFDK
jgi:arylsulfatase A-like enzyme